MEPTKAAPLTTPSSGKRIGILALQGDYDKHRAMLEDSVGAQTAFVRTSDELNAVDALVLPGGESTAMIRLLQRIGLDEAIRERAQAGMPIFGTCAGLILLARDIEDRPDQPTLNLLNLRVARNAFGRQVDSFEADVPFAVADENQTESDARPVRGVFIRAPYVVEAGPDVEIISRFRDRIVGVRQASLLATAFHPELTNDAQVHAYFARIVEKSEENR